jgi:hypothetical protein
LQFIYIFKFIPTNDSYWIENRSEIDCSFVEIFIGQILKTNNVVSMVFSCKNAEKYVHNVICNGLRINSIVEHISKFCWQQDVHLGVYQTKFTVHINTLQTTYIMTIIYYLWTKIHCIVICGKHFIIEQYLDEIINPQKPIIAQYIPSNIHKIYFVNMNSFHNCIIHPPKLN